METIPVSARRHVQCSKAQPEAINALYTLDDYLEPCDVRPVTAMTQPVPFDSKVMYRVYFEHSDTSSESELDLTQPHAHIFCQSDGERSIEYTFIPLTIAPEIEWLERIVKTREFLSPARKRWGLFRLFCGCPRFTQVHHKGANMMVDYHNGLGAAYLRRVGVPSTMTFADVLSDYRFLGEVMSWMGRFNRTVFGELIP